MRKKCHFWNEKIPHHGLKQSFFISFFVLASDYQIWIPQIVNYVFIQSIFLNNLYHTQDEENRAFFGPKFTNSLFEVIVLFFFFVLASILTSLNTWSKNYIYIGQIFYNIIHHTQDEENRTFLDCKFTNSLFFSFLLFILACDYTNLST